MDFSGILSDPNFIKMLGNAGQTIANGGSVGEALNPASTIGQIQEQKATAELLAKLLGGSTSNNTTAPVSNISQVLGGGQGMKQNVAPFSTGGNNPAMQNIMDAMKGVTPVGQDGIDGITHNITPTGATTTIKNSPNVSNFGQTIQGEGQKRQSPPFSAALLG